MEPRYLAESLTHQQTIKKSRFITRLFPLEQADAAKELIAQVRKQDHAARHHATAMIVGPDAALQRSNDDGEPAGTAGAPMLQALQRAAVTDILAVVTRYFGGVLLGKAGLAAAYGGGVEEALRLARFLVKRRQTGFAFDVPVAQAGRVGHELRQFAATHLGAQAGDAEWGTGAGTTVRLELWVDSAEAAEAESWLERMGAGAAPQLVGQRLVTIAE